MAAPNSNTPAVSKKDMFNTIQTTVNQHSQAGELHLPHDYSAGNALKSAFLILQGTLTRDNRPVLEACTPLSIHNALYSMVVQGLNPDKKQCYFIAYGNTLTCQRSYFGAMALAKRLDHNIADIVAEVVYKGDVLKYKIIKGRKVISDHEQEFLGEQRPIVGAYAMVIDHDGNVVSTELMTIDKIHQSWRQSKQNPFDDKGNIKPGSVHGKFPEEMAKRTVINKVCKPIINSSDDSSILGRVIRQSERDADEAAFEVEYQATANSTPLPTFQDDQSVDVTHNPAETIDEQTGEVLDQGPGGDWLPPAPSGDLNPPVGAPPFAVA